MVVDGSLRAAILTSLLQFPRVPLLVVYQPGEVVTLVKKLENGRENLGFFVGERDLLSLRVHQLVFQDALKEGRGPKNVLMSSKDPLLLANDESDNG